MDLSFTGYIAGFSIVISFLPQAIKVFKTRKVSSLSFLMYLFFNLGTFLWIVYGIATNSIPVALFNGITFLLSMPILIMIFKYRGKEEIEVIEKDIEHKKS